jgi:hypothetical protein
VKNWTVRDSGPCKHPPRFLHTVLTFSSGRSTNADLKVGAHQSERWIPADQKVSATVLEWGDAEGVSYFPVFWRAGIITVIEKRCFLWQCVYRLRREEGLDNCGGALPVPDVASDDQRRLLQVAAQCGGVC